MSASFDPATEELCISFSQLSIHCPSAPKEKKHTEMLTSPVTGDTKNVIEYSEDEATKNFKGSIIVCEYLLHGQARHLSAQPSGSSLSPAWPDATCCLPATDT
ncbi:unnamed protein product [Coregonus sp. 'balchen']|nr:unnamed protein product [Coregonus sp. 'balchen']